MVMFCNVIISLDRYQCRPNSFISFIFLIIIQIKMRSFNSSKHINGKNDGPYRSFGYLSLFSDPLDLGKWSKIELLYFSTFNRIVHTKTNIEFLISQNTLADLKGPKGKYTLR